MTELYELSLAHAAIGIQEMTISPVALVESYLARIDALEPKLHAWVMIMEEDAIHEASLCEAEARKGEFRGPLHGIPMGVKDIFHTKGVKTEAGSKAFAGFVPNNDAFVVKRLKDAGAIILGKTVTTELAMSDPKNTRNPYNLNHTPGGSSSGSGAAVAAMMCPAAIGSQTAGSTLRPASYCGIVGLKPTYGIIDCNGMFPLAPSLDHVGFLTRTVSDAVYLLDAALGTSLFSQSILFDNPKIGFDDALLNQADRETQRHFLKVVGELEDNKAETFTVGPRENLEEVGKSLGVILCTEAAIEYGARFQKNEMLFGPQISDVIRKGIAYTKEDYAKAMLVRERFRQRLLALFDEYEVDVLLVPTTPTPAPRNLTTTGSSALISPFTFVGFPSITIPSRLSENGMPFGIQLIARPMDEETLFSIARWCEKILNFQARPSFSEE